MSVAFAAIAPVVSTAIAQDEAAVDQESRQDRIIVTATKRDESIQDVPISISQVSGDDLEAQGIQNIENLAYIVPSLEFGSNGGSTYTTIRGIGTSVDSGVAEPAVATYVDGVFLPRSTMAVMSHLDLERVEVLRGPQGTLYGRNATGGSINYISRGPTDEFEAGMRAVVENRDGYDLGAFVSGPITDELAFRVSGGYKNRDGYIEIINTGENIGGDDKVYGRVALEYTPTSDLSINLAAQYEQDVEPKVATLTLSRQLLADLLFPGNNQTTEVNKLYSTAFHKTKTITTILSGHVDWEISDSVSFRSITGYVDHEFRAWNESTGTDALVARLYGFDSPSESFSQEFNLYGDTDKLDWLIGAYYYDADFSLLLPVEFGSAVLGIPGPNFAVYLDAADLGEKTKTYALFTDLTYSLTDRLRLNAGLRYNEEKKEFTFFGPASPAGDLKTDDILPKLGIQYDVSDEANVYLQWQQGIKSGGHQLDRVELFQPEELSSWELGYKGQYLDGDLTVNAAIYLYDYKDLQVTTTIPPSTTLVTNSDAEVLGGELEVFYDLTDNVSLNLGVSVTDGQYKDLDFFDQFSQTTLDLDGEELVRAPDYTVSAGGQWTIPVNGDVLKDVVLRGNIYHSDDYKLTLVDYPLTRQDPYTTGNISATFTSASERAKLRFYVDNVAGEEVLQTGGYLFLGFTGFYSQPETYGAELTVNF